MTSCPTLPECDDRAARRERDAAYYRATLHELADMAMDIARTLHRRTTQEQAAPQPSPETVPETQPAADPTIAFDRIARTIRRTVALARTLDQPVRPAPAQDDAPRQRVAARVRILREVEDVIQRRTEGAEADCLRDELYERLVDASDLDDDLASQPVADVIQVLLRDLGLAASFPGTRAWARRTPADVRDLRARAARLVGAQPPHRPGIIPSAAAPWLPRPPTPPARPGTGPPP